MVKGQAETMQSAANFLKAVPLLSPLSDEQVRRSGGPQGSALCRDQHCAGISIVQGSALCREQHCEGID